MATRKKTVTRKKAKSPAKRPAKKPVKKPVKKAAKKPAPRPAKKPAPKVAAPRPAAKRPPMHAVVDATQFVDAPAEHDETFEIFKSFDRDGSGSIDRAEFARLLEALGQAISDDELAIAVDVVDTNRSGRISWPEFKAWWSAR